MNDYTENPSVQRLSKGKTDILAIRGILTLEDGSIRYLSIEAPVSAIASTVRVNNQLTLLISILVAVLLSGCGGIQWDKNAATAQDDSKASQDASANDDSSSEENVTIPARVDEGGVGSYTEITLSGSGVAVSGSGASVSGSKITLTDAGHYRIRGALSDGQIQVQAEGATVSGGTTYLTASTRAARPLPPPHQD